MLASLKSEADFSGGRAPSNATAYLRDPPPSATQKNWRLIGRAQVRRGSRAVLPWAALELGVDVNLSNEDVLQNLLALDSARCHHTPGTWTVITKPTASPIKLPANAAISWTDNALAKVLATVREPAANRTEGPTNARA